MLLNIKYVLASRHGRKRKHDFSYSSSLLPFVVTTNLGRPMGACSCRDNMDGKLTTAFFVVAVLGCWTYQAIQPPPPRICGSPNGPPITSPRIQLRDGRHLSYMESGVPRKRSKHRVVVVHGFGATKEFTLPASPELVEEVRICFVSYDRAGYGESDPNPKRSVESEAMDIQELADKLELGQRFYVVGVSMGAFPAWGCLKYIPHRLAGVALVVPAVNYWWPSFPANLSSLAFWKLPIEDRRTFWIARNAPRLLHVWMSQKLFSISATARGDPIVFSKQDLEIMQGLKSKVAFLQMQKKCGQQGVFESLHRDMLVLFGRWEFDPMELEDPFDGNGSVHIWQGREDRIVPWELQRYVHQKLAWVEYHECQECGHMLLYADDWSHRVLKALLPGEDELRRRDGPSAEANLAQ